LRHPGQHLAAPGLDIQGQRGPADLLAHQLLVAPRRALLSGAAIQPGEIPAIDVDGGGLGDQLLETLVHDL
jgi:hypothetical protein